MKEKLYTNNPSVNLENEQLDSRQEEVKIQAPIGSQIGDTVKKKRSIGKIIAIIAVIIVGVLSAGAVYGYYTYIKPPLMVRDALEQLGEVKAMSYDVSVDMELLNPEMVQQVLLDQESSTAVMAGSIISGINSVSVNAQVYDDNLDEAMRKQKIDIQLSADNGNFDVNVLRDAGVYYLRLNDAPEIPFLTSEELEGRWIKFDATDVLETIAMARASFADSSEEEKKDDIFNLTTEQKTDLLKLLLKTKPVSLKRLSSGEINGMKTTELKVVFNKKGIKEFVPQAVDILGLNEDEVSKEDLDSFEENIDKIRLPELIVSLGKKDNKLYKMVIDQVIEYPVYESDVLEIAMKMEVLMGNYDEPLILDIPDDAKTLEEIQEEMMAEMMGEEYMMMENVEIEGSSMSTMTLDEYGDILLESDSTPEIEKTDIDSDGDGLSDYTEELLELDPNNPDTDGDGYNDGQELKGGYNPHGEGKLGEDEMELVEYILSKTN